MKKRRFKRIPPNLRRLKKKRKSRKVVAFSGIAACFLLAIIIAFVPGKEKKIIDISRPAGSEGGQNGTLTGEAGENGFNNGEGTGTTEGVITPTPDTMVMPTPNAATTEGTLTVTFFDVGQADAALISCNGHHMLVDGGNKGDSDLMYIALKNRGIDYLDIVVASHVHEDHVGGLSGALTYASAGLVLCSKDKYEGDAFGDFKELAEKKGGGIVIPSAGDSYKLGDANISVLGVNGGEDDNNSSIILKVSFGEISFLFTGDAERAAEQAVLDSSADLSATVLKVAHHGSNTSTIYPFLREVMPEYAVISVGENNEYGHPHEDTLSRLRDCGTEVYRTDESGEICFVTDGKEIKINLQE